MHFIDKTTMLIILNTFQFPNSMLFTICKITEGKISVIKQKTLFELIWNMKSCFSIKFIMPEIQIRGKARRYSLILSLKAIYSARIVRDTWEPLLRLLEISRTSMVSLKPKAFLSLSYTFLSNS